VRQQGRQWRAERPTREPLPAFYEWEAAIMNETAYIQGNERTIRERNALSPYRFPHSRRAFPDDPPPREIATAGNRLNPNTDRH
jgi:hypothetical protein